jgi:hypothetical protein
MISRTAGSQSREPSGLWAARGLRRAAPPLSRNPPAAIEPRSQQDPLFCDPTKFLRHPRKIDNLDRIECRRLLEFVVDRDKNCARDGAGPSIPMSISERSRAEPVAGDPNRKTREVEPGTCCRIIAAADLAASTGSRVACILAVILRRAASTPANAAIPQEPEFCGGE